MKAFTSFILTLLIGGGSMSARSLSTASIDCLSVKIDPETVIEVMVDEVSAADFMRLMPQAAHRPASGPAASVTLEEAVEYCRRLTEVNRKLGLLKAHETLRLPTLKEWSALATAPLSEREGLLNLDSGLRELCSDNKVETFPSRDNPAETVDYRYVAVIGAHDKLEAYAVGDAMTRPAWIRAETCSEVVGFRLVLDSGHRRIKDEE
jgi:hypothetical protein